MEVEAFAAPKTMGLWDDVREDLLASNPEAEAVDGIFGTEVKLPVKLPNGKTAHTRIVGVDGPRWMLRGIFSGKAASDPDGTETKILNDAFAQIVVERGDEPLSPRDLIPMARPLTPNERHALAAGRRMVISQAMTTRRSPAVRMARCPLISKWSSRPRCAVARCSPKCAEGT